MSRKFWSLCLAAILAPTSAFAMDDTEQSLGTLWEVLWHQSGTPTRVVRWENDIRMRVSGVELPRHREYVMKALREVFFKQRGLERRQVSLSGYWAQGRVEDVFQAEKKLPVGQI